MLEYYDVSGCYILRPWAYKIWQEIQRRSTLFIIFCWRRLITQDTILFMEKEAHWINKKKAQNKANKGIYFATMNNRMVRQRDSGVGR